MKLRSLAVLAVFVGAALGAPSTPFALKNAAAQRSASPRDEADNHIRLGAALLKQTNKHNQAIAHFKRAVALQPKYALAYLWLGDAYEKWGDAAPPNSNARLSRYNTARKTYGDAAEFAVPNSLDARDARRKRAIVEGKISQTIVGPPIRVSVNNQSLALPLRPITRSSRVLLPLDTVMSALGARKSGYDPLANTITYELDNRTIQVQINVRVVTVLEKSGDLQNQRRVILAIPLTEVRSGGRDYAMIESAFFRDALGTDVQWSAASRLVRIASAKSSSDKTQLIVGTLLQVDPVEPVTLRLLVDGKEQTLTATSATPVVRRRVKPDEANKEINFTQLSILGVSDFPEKITLADLVKGEPVAVKLTRDSGSQTVEWIASLQGVGATTLPTPLPVDVPDVETITGKSPAKTFEIAAQKGGLLHMAAAGDGSTFVTSGSDKTIKLWKLEAGKIEPQLMRTWNVSSPANALAFSSDGNRLAAGGDDGVTQIFDARDGRALKSLSGAVGPIVALAFSPDGSLLAAGARERSTLPRGEVKLWHVESGQLKQKLPELQSAVTGLSFSLSGALATLSGRFYVDLWKQGGGAYDYDRSFIERWGKMQALAFSPDGQSLVAANEDGSLRLWNLSAASNRELKWTARSNSNSSAITAVAFTSDGKSIASGDANGVLRMWNSRDGKLLAFWPSTEKNPIVALAAAPRNQLLTAFKGGTLTGWNLKP